MIIPIRCMSCGNVIADKWNYYKEQLKKVKKTGNSYEDRFYMDGTAIPQTIEMKVMNDLGFKKACAEDAECRVWIKVFMCLRFLQLDDIDSVWTEQLAE